MNKEDELVAKIMKEDKHPLNAIRHLLTSYKDIPAPALTRMTRQILAKFPPESYGKLPCSSKRASTKRHSKKQSAGKPHKRRSTRRASEFKDRGFFERLFD